MDRPVKEILKQCRDAYLALAPVTAEQRSQALNRFADLLEERSEQLLAANAHDLAEQKGKISAALYQRLELGESKIKVLAQGMRDLAAMDDAVGSVEWRRQLDDGLILERVRVPLGVLGIIFESRPDVIPQILSLVLKSGNAAALKGGKEALHSNRAFMQVVEQLSEEFDWLPQGWAALLETRSDVDEMLKSSEYLNLVIPRGSNELVQSVMARTQVPVLGHADGICHVFVEETADLKQALHVLLDAKAQYPSACNAMETLLVDAAIAEKFLPDLAAACAGKGIHIFGCESSRKILPELDVAENWSTEFGELKFNLKVVAGVGAAIDHINRYGSHHTDCICTTDKAVGERFLKEVDSSSVFLNASTRFADGFRYGMGAEVGISTARTHARGPVGLDGLMIYKYVLRGENQTAADYSGLGARKFQHKDLN